MEAGANPEGVSVAPFHFPHKPVLVDGQVDWLRLGVTSRPRQVVRRAPPGRGISCKASVSACGQDWNIKQDFSRELDSSSVLLVANLSECICPLSIWEKPSLGLWVSNCASLITSLHIFSLYWLYNQDLLKAYCWGTYDKKKKNQRALLTNVKKEIFIVKCIELTRMFAAPEQTFPCNACPGQRWQTLWSHFLYSYIPAPPLTFQKCSDLTLPSLFKPHIAFFHIKLLIT